MNLLIKQSLTVLGTNIQKTRLIHNLSQSVVAERAGVSIRTVQEVESGNPSVEIGNLAAVIRAIKGGYPFETFLSPETDELGKTLDEMRRPKRVRRKK